MKIKRVLIGALIIGIIFMTPSYKSFVLISNEMRNQKVMVIDPGHGGMDGGASSESGIQEKNINLEIAKELRKEAEKYGFRVVMTREEDIGLYDENNSVIRSKKIQDLKGRKKIIDEVKPDLTVSIHLNSFKEDKRVRGAQVFYPKYADEQMVAASGKAIAESVQKALEASIDDGKERFAMAKNDIYLFKDVYTPIILVECGFLSNFDDEKNLKAPAFQQKIARSIMGGIAKYYGINIQKRLKVIDSGEQRKS